MNTTLVLITADFPYAAGETFLETEINYLCEYFEKVVIITTNIDSEAIRKVPTNCIVKRLNINYTKELQLKSVFNYFHPILKEERKIIKDKYRLKLSNGVIKTMLISFERGKRLMNFLKSQNFDYSTTVFYSYWGDDAAIGLSLLANSNNEVKAVSRIHRWDIYFEESKIYYLPFRHFITRYLKKIYSISNDGINYVQKKWKVSTNTFSLSRLGINNSVKLQVNTELPFKIVSCSNLIPVKRVSLIVDSLQLIKDFPVEWTHFGDGSKMDFIKEAVNHLPANIKVNLKGRIPNTDIYKAYEEIQPHLFINVSSSEGIPVSIMEAMSFGIPCLATDAGGNNEIVNKENGKLIPIRITAEEVATEILYFINLKSDERERMVENAYNTWKEKYNADTNYSEFCNELKAL